MEGRIEGELNTLGKETRDIPYFQECNALLSILNRMRDEVEGEGEEIDAIIENIRPRYGEGGGEEEEELWFALGRGVREFVAEVGLREVIRG